MSGSGAPQEPGATGGSALLARMPASQVESLRKGLSAAVARICPYWMSLEREDLVQTALLRIVSLLGSEEPLREVNATYLWKTAYSVTLDEIRRARWRFERSPAQYGSLSEGRIEAAPDPEKAASAREICLHVRSCLESLESSRRRAVLMRLGGYSYDETAQRLGMSPKQVANFVHRGMKDLRSCLQAKGVTA